MKKVLAVILAIVCVFSMTACTDKPKDPTTAEGSWTCPDCKTVNTGNFCSKCGHAKDDGTWQCPTCGTVNTGNFCSKCGAAKGGSAEPTTAAPETTTAAPETTTAAPTTAAPETTAAPTTAAPETTTAAPEPTTEAKDSSYIFPTSDSAYLVNKDVEGKTDAELRLGRNEIYARHGYIFGSKDLKEYFEGKAWYTPAVKSSDFDEKVFNKYEEANLDFILQTEHDRSMAGVDVEAEIDKFLNARPNNGFLNCRFSKPGSDVRLREIVYQMDYVGTTIEKMKKALDKEGKTIECDLSFITASKLDDYLLKVTGYGLWDKSWDKSGVQYCESLDVYYIDHGDTNICPVKIIKVTDKGNDKYEVKCEEKLTHNSGDYILVTLKRKGTDSYRFISVKDHFE